jgi:hypothetical protein
MSDDDVEEARIPNFEWDESDFVSQNDLIENSAEHPKKKQKLVLSSPTQHHIPTPEDQIYTYEDDDEFEQFEDYAPFPQAEATEHAREQRGEGEGVEMHAEEVDSPLQAIPRTQGVFPICDYYFNSPFTTIDFIFSRCSSCC